MIGITPVFQTSVGKNSLLTLDKPKGEFSLLEPISIFSIAIKHGLKQIVVLEKDPAWFWTAYELAKKHQIQLIYGHQFYFKTSEENRPSKVNVFILNSDGYADFCKLYSCYAIDCNGFFSSWKEFGEHITPNLRVAIPFYDSFLFNNNLYFNDEIPSFSGFEPSFFLEDHSLPFDGIMKKKVKSFVEGRYPLIPVKSVYYYQKQHFRAYMMLKVIQNKSNFEKPDLPHFSVDTFSYV